VFLAKFQLMLEKVDLFKSHQYILAGMLLSVRISLSVVAAVRAVPVGNRGAGALCIQ